MRVKEKKKKEKKTPPTGLEPAIFGSIIVRSHLTTIRRPTPYPLGHGGGMWEKV